MKKILSFLLLVPVLAGCVLKPLESQDRPAASCDNIDRVINVVYEDDDVIVVNKQAGVSAFYSGEKKDEPVAELLRVRAGCRDLSAETQWFYRVDALDRGAQGLILFAKNKKAQQFLLRQSRDGNIEKRYFTIVEGVVKKDGGVINAPVDKDPADKTGRKMKTVKKGTGQDAATGYTVMRRLKNATYLDVSERTRRRHQVRAHLASVGHPVFGDAAYGATFSGGFSGGLAMQAYFLRFKRPFSNEILELQLTPADRLAQAVDFAQSRP